MLQNTRLLENKHGGPNVLRVQHETPSGTPSHKAESVTAWEGEARGEVSTPGTFGLSR